jgi:two-component system chemotaxis sensor kinase CheA
VHTIKGTCGFLGLPRLEALAHAAETLMGKFRDGMPVTGAAVTLILSTIDRVKQLAQISAGVRRLDGQLLVILDVERVLDIGLEATAA